MLEKPRIDIQIDGIYQSRHAEQESSLKSYVEQLPSLLISFGPMTEIRDPIYIWELLKGHRKKLCIIPFFISKKRARKNVKKFWKRKELIYPNVSSNRWKCEILNNVQ